MTPNVTARPALDEPKVRRKMAAARNELPSGPIVPDDWHANKRRLRPRFVTASVVVAVSSASILATAIAAATTTVPIGALMVLGAASILGTLFALFATWPTHRRASPVPRIMAGVAAAATLFAVAAATLDFAV